ncbi:DUF1571 domain-containing protein [Ramlibacter sp. 2FC]|uniref:LolA family protein n=1 Tax=Ramlibacter sp. 2FC TaxID=2502188 RepID=UPI001BB100FE|nr:DUF1571 domain-containing protein [Ramlibacter sp. 2FC]
MRWGLLLALALTAEAMADPLDEAQARFQALGGYQLILRSTAADGQRQQLRYFFRRPGWVRMEFLEPHRGLVLVYDPEAQRISLWPFGPGRWPRLRLAPDSPLLRERHGHRIDRSDVGALLENLQALRARGRLSPLGEAAVGGRQASGWEIAGDASTSVAGVQRYRVWFARDTLFPLQVESFGPGGAPIETVTMDEIETNPVFSAQVFAP